MAYPPTVDDFKARFTRDFGPYGNPGGDSVTDADIKTALADAVSLFNKSLWSSPVEVTTAFLLLAAHFMRLNIDAAGGLSAINIARGMNVGAGGVVENKTVGSVSVGYAIPPGLRNSPVWSPLLQTRYGARYAAMAWPRTRGAVSVAAGFVESDVSNGDPTNPNPAQT